MDVDEQPATHPIRTIQLSSGRVVRFHLDSVIDPPPISITTALLESHNGMWDENPAFWKGESLLWIRDLDTNEEVAVPFVLWPEVYQYKKTQQWKAIKNQWNMLKVRFIPAAGLDVRGAHLQYAVYH
jgi:hypothetical protein